MMTSEKFGKLSVRDFENGAVLDETASALKDGERMRAIVAALAKDYEMARARLRNKDGAYCPLCGSCANESPEHKSDCDFGKLLAERAADRVALPEELIVAVLHKVGKDITLESDRRLDDAFNDVACKGCTFEGFAAHPRYGYSRLLAETLQSLCHGGSILREAGTNRFRASTHTAGMYGWRVWRNLTSDQRAAVEELAADIREIFGQEV